jgi:pyruvate carboxylase
MPGKVASIGVRPGQKVTTGERLLSIEAMKMETAVYSPRDAIVAEVHVTPGTVVEARDLLFVLKDA